MADTLFMEPSFSSVPVMLFYQHEFIWPQYIPDTLLLHAEQKGHHICQVTRSYVNKCYRAYEVLTSVIPALRVRQGDYVKFMISFDYIMYSRPAWAT